MILLVAVNGCCCAQSKRMQAPSIVNPARSASWYDWLLGSTATDPSCINNCAISGLQTTIHPSARSSVALGEQAYDAAERLHADGDDRAVDYWARTIAWMDDARRRSGHSNGFDEKCREIRVRNSALIRILSCGQAYGRLDPSSHLLINGSDHPFRIPIVHQGFAWKQNDFQRLLVLKPPSGSAGNVCGRGIPLMVFTASKPREESSPDACDSCDRHDQSNIRCDSFLDSQIPFAATALINIPISLFQTTTSRDDEILDGSVAASLSLINPLTIDPLECNQIAQSPAMPLVYARQASQFNPISAFLNGDNGIDRPRLAFLEPYQADKVPLILVHGLISNPATFLEVADAVRADPLLRRRYQIWVFRYPTGDEFLESAAVLRQELARAFACQGKSADPIGVATANHPVPRAVIVGHSMGGLLSKLQVTDSGEQLWRSICRVPLEELQASPNVVSNFRKLFFFQPNPNIGRVIYIATPHQGSPWASRCIGRLATSLAGDRADEEQDFEEITRNNPGVFSGEFSESLPSSVGLLQPSSRLLHAIASVPSSPQVLVNSIIGNHCSLPQAGPSDGVVAVESAFRCEAESTTIVNATHTSILRARETQQSLLTILRMHLSTPTTASSDVLDHPSQIKAHGSVVSSTILTPVETVPSATLSRGPLLETTNMIETEVSALDSPQVAQLVLDPTVVTISATENPEFLTTK